MSSRADWKSQLSCPRAALIAGWFVLLFQILNILDGRPLSFPEPGSAETIVLATLFATSTIYPRVHVVVALFIVSLHPLTTVFGRDGAMLLMLLYVGLVIVFRTSYSPRGKLLLATLLLCVPVVDLSLSLIERFERRRLDELLDYGDLLGPPQEGGFLRPGLDVLIVGESGPVRFVTNELGFRRRESTDRKKPPATFRILLVGDSFVVGYRTGQEKTLGHVLESKLNLVAGSRSVEVLSAGAGQPDAYFDYLQQHGLMFDPDLVVVGITLANDISQVYATQNNLSFTGDLLSHVLPDDAYSGSYARVLLVRLDRSFYSWRGYRRVRRLLLPEGVDSWFDDVPGEVHVFDPSHALGYFYTRQTLTSVEKSFAELERFLSRIVALCRDAGVELVFAIFPQRFQVSEREWNAAVFRYALDRTAFDLEHPNQRIQEMCDQLQARCTDLLDPMARQSSQRLYLPQGDMHWSERGHYVAGEALANYLAPFLTSEE